MKKILRITGLVIALIATVLYGFAKSNHISKISMDFHSKVNQSTFDHIAMEEYDVVSYYSLKEPVLGTKEFSVEWNNATWLFENQNNANKFENDPEKYAPEFGGYCGYAVSTGFTASPDPLVYTINKGNLYLFSETKVKTEFFADSTLMIEATTNWR